MYYDMIASLPHLPHFEQAERLPITPLRLKERLRRLQPEHADQLARARSLVRWRPDRLIGTTDAAFTKDYARLIDSSLEKPLREYVAFRMEQQTVLAAMRRKQDELGPPQDSASWGAAPRGRFLQQHWNAPHFGLVYVYPWIPQAGDLLSAGDALGLDRLLMDLAWRWLCKCSERNTFGFEAVFAYVFKWDILQAYLACDADAAKIRFTELVGKVTYVEHA